MHFKNIAVGGLVPGMVFGRALSRRAVVCGFVFQPYPGDTCESFASFWQIQSLDILEALNPGLTCPDLDINKAYCVIGTVTDDDTPTTISTQTSTGTQAPGTTQPPTTTSAPAPGTTPSPTQLGMVDNCNRFHWVEPGQNCYILAALYSITVDQVIQWNPAAQSDCTNLWAERHACVGVE